MVEAMNDELIHEAPAIRQPPELFGTRARRRLSALGTPGSQAACLAPSVTTLGGLATRKPACERPQHEPRLGRQGHVGDDTDEDAERQAQHCSERDGGSGPHIGESTAAAASEPWLQPKRGARGPSRAADVSPFVSPSPFERCCRAK